jgi:hypothetical protein
MVSGDPQNGPHVGHDQRRPIAECDYRSLHAAMLYNQVGIPFEGDAYDVDGFSRDEVKAGFNIALNAKNDRAAVAALADKLDCDRGPAGDNITATKRRHRPIERATLYRGRRGRYHRRAGHRPPQIVNDVVAAHGTPCDHRRAPT